MCFKVTELKKIETFSAENNQNVLISKMEGCYENPQNNVF